jgi:cyclic dehypoxanthinyl futalosine synthase
MTTIWQEALERLQGNDLLQLGMDADAVRQRLWPERVVTYTVGQLLNIGGAVLPIAEAEAAVERGAHGFVLTSHLSTNLTSVAHAVSELHMRFPDVVLTGFSEHSIALLSTNATVADTLERLFDAGLSALGSSSIETDPADPGGWLAIHREAHAIGLPTVASIPLRSHETPEQWVARLEEVAMLQQETHGFLACEPRIEHLERALDEVTGARYLQFVALARLYLEEVPHVQTDWSIFGPKVLQLALRFGADDAGLVLASERNPKIPSHHSGEEELRRIIRDAGFEPVQRDAVYGRSFVY